MADKEKPLPSSTVIESRRWWAEPFLWVFTAIFVTAAAASSYYSNEWTPVLFLASVRCSYVSCLHGVVEETEVWPSCLEATHWRGTTRIGWSREGR